MKQWVPTLLALAILSGPAIAENAPSVERGKELFTATQLGTNGKSCATCHPGGKGLDGAAEFDDARLAGIVNQCIRQPLEGRPLDPASGDMKSLVMYLKTFSGHRH